MMNTSSYSIKSTNQIEGFKKVQVKHLSKRSENIMQGCMFKYNDKNLQASVNRFE